jgi:hypothetical protein
MVKAALVGAVVLATVGSVSVSSQGIGVAPAAAQEVVVNDAQIAQLKQALQLTALQERHWRPVEATLRAMAQARYRLASADDSFVQRIHSRVSGYTLTAVSMARLKSAARPLIHSLSDEQKSAGMSILSSMGVSF